MDILVHIMSDGSVVTARGYSILVPLYERGLELVQTMNLADYISTVLFPQVYGLLAVVI